MKIQLSQIGVRGDSPRSWTVDRKGAEEPKQQSLGISYLALPCNFKLYLLPVLPSLLNYVSKHRGQLGKLSDSSV